MARYRLDLPDDGRYHTVYADPPWSYDNPRWYDRMTLEEIKDIPVEKATGPDAHLWLWTTNTYLPRALEVVDAWGFTYRSMLTWEKNRVGTGWWLRNKSEHLIFAAKSKKLRRTPRSHTTMLHAKWRKRNKKPDEVFDIIEDLSPGPWLELFATQEHPGWDCYSAPSDPEKDPYPRLKHVHRRTEMTHGPEHLPTGFDWCPACGETWVRDD